jgi:hypothetical protein
VALGKLIPSGDGCPFAISRFKSNLRIHRQCFYVIIAIQRIFFAIIPYLYIYNSKFCNHGFDEFRGHPDAADA